MKTNAPISTVKTIEDHVSLLGKRVRCRVTRFEGVVITVAFDLFGCIQAVVHPGLGDDGRLRETHWFDVSRLEVIEAVRVMQLPSFQVTPEEIANGEHGCAERPCTTQVIVPVVEPKGSMFSRYLDVSHAASEHDDGKRQAVGF